MFEAVTADLVFTISLKRSTQNLQLSTSSPADYPIYAPKAIDDRLRKACRVGPTADLRSIDSRGGATHIFRDKRPNLTRFAIIRDHSQVAVAKGGPVRSLARANDVKHRILGNASATERFATKVLDIELLNIQSCNGKPLKEIALAVLSDVIAHAEIFPAQRFRINARVFMSVV